MIILFLFLLNFRTTFITLTAIPLSIVVTALVFKFFGLSINTMTLGGLAVAIGELVDDAIVDVENIFRRLKENRNQRSPKHPLLVVFQASVEIRNSIVFGTMIVVLVFLPLFALQGIEGRLFTPLGIAYIVSILSSLLVSLTVTPVLSYWLLSRTGSPHDESSVEHDSWLLRLLKWIAGGAIRLSLKIPGPVLVVAMAVVLLAAIAASSLQRDFLPPFNEGAAQINVVLPAGTSLAKADRVGRIAEERLQQIPEILSIVRRTGRAELDEHAMGVNISEIIVSLDQHSRRRIGTNLLDELRESLDDIPGIVTSVEQPLAHLISHMLSGVMAEVAIKIYGDDLDTLRAEARKMEAAIEGVAGVEDLQIEQQTIIPQMRIEVRGDRLQQYGLTRADVTEFIETAMNGRVVSSVAIVGVKIVEITNLNQQAEKLDAAIEQAMRYTFPEVREIRDARALLQSKLRGLGRGDGGGSSTEFLDTLAIVAGAVTGKSNIDAELETINYRSGVMELRVTAPNVEALDSIQKEIIRDGSLEAEIQSANPEGDKVRGRIQIRSAGA